jgi:hypothetical protein
MRANATRIREAIRLTFTTLAAVMSRLLAKGQWGSPVEATARVFAFSDACSSFPARDCPACASARDRGSCLVSPVI